MDNIPVKRSMDEFLINPIVPMDVYSGYRDLSSPTRKFIPLDQPTELIKISPRKKSSDVSAKIGKFDNQEIFWRDYVSDEEEASPVDDEFTFDSTSSDVESIPSIYEADYHALTSDDAQQLCHRAQAVRYLSAGKAKVVSMPKLVNVSAASSPKASIHEPESRPSVSSVSHMRPATSSHYVYSSSRNSSSRSSGEGPRYSATVPRTPQPTGANSLHRKPDLPRLQTGSRSGLAQPDVSSSTPRTPFPRGPLPGSSVQVTPSPTQSTRKQQRQSPAFSLKSLSRSLRGCSTSDSSSASSSKLEISAPLPSPKIPDVHVPRRTSSKRLPKMVARGADERAAAIDIPPCPEDYEDDFRVLAWPPRSDSVGNFEPPRRAATTTHRRRKSHSALVSTRA